MIDLPDPPDEESPPGQGMVDLEADILCPYCGETCSIALDPGGGEAQEYFEDCPVCCRSWLVRVVYDGDGQAEVRVEEGEG
jgi:hypothetical protein